MCPVFCSQNDYPEVYRYALSVFPSEDDDVITSPYNAMMSSRTLMRSADCVLPVENQALMNICSAIESRGKKENLLHNGFLLGKANGKGTICDKRHNLLLFVTSSLGVLATEIFFGRKFIPSF